MRRNLMRFAAVTLMMLFVGACSAAQVDSIQITDAKTASSIDAQYKPVGPANVFPAGTAKVACWFSWKNASKDAKVIAKWHYLTDDISILDHTFAVPRKEGSGGVMLTMPEGKTLPPGNYRVTLDVSGRTAKSLYFKVAEKS